MLDQFKRETKRREILILILIRELRLSHKALKMRGSVIYFYPVRPVTNEKKPLGIKRE